jgi:DNA-binding IscR family transcriptional regulator
MNNSDCSIRPVLRHLQNVVDEVLGSLTLKSLLRNERDMGTSWTSPRAVPLPVVARTS